MITAERSAEIARIYYNDLNNYISKRIKNKYDAEDIAQDVFLLFQERYTDLDDDNIRAWLYKVADNKIKEKYREIAKQEKLHLLSLFPGYEKSADVVYEMEEDYKITDDELEEKKKTVMESLTEKELKLFEMVYNKHMEYKELAKALEITENNARVRVCRLRAKISEKTSYLFMAILLLLMRI